jgi:hypothetical protein
VTSWLVGKYAATETVQLDVHELRRVIEYELNEFGLADYRPDTVDKRLLGRVRAGIAIEASFVGGVPDEVIDTLPPLAVALTSRVVRELEVIADNLLDAKSDLFGPIDRLRGEAELRYAVLPPLVALVVLLAATSSPFWLLGFLAVPALLYDAFRKSDERLKRLAAALTNDIARSPTVRRLDQSLNALLERAAREREQREQDTATADWLAHERKPIPRWRNLFASLRP